jgi:choline-sulfatase
MNRPNILLLCSDQHNARVMGCAGDGRVSTPTLDALAAEGTRFTNAYCNDPLCVPSRASFMTGRYPFHCEVLGNQDVLDSRIPTLAHIAVRGGYHAVLAGKMHFNGPDQHHGFLEYLTGDLGARCLHGAPDHGQAPGLQHLGNCSRPDALRHTGAGRNPMVAYDDDVTADVLAWLSEYSVQAQRPPFFLTVGFLQPHCPYIAPAERYHRYVGQVQAPRPCQKELLALHPHHQDYRRAIELDHIPSANQDRALAAYYGLVDQLDRNIGRLVDGLKSSGLWDNTIIVSCSDHGDMLGAHGRWHKECFFEEAARVPLIIRDPRLAGPSVVGHPCSLVDLMPTLCDWAGVPCPPGVDGHSLLPSLLGNGAPNLPVKCESYTHWTQHEHGMSCNRMVRSGKWKLCYYGAYDSGELYDLEADPQERCNRISDPACAETLRSLMAEIHCDGWSRHILDQLHQRLNQRGERDNLTAYREALRQSLRDQPRHVDIHAMWPRSYTEPTLLDTEPICPGRVDAATP